MCKGVILASGGEYWGVGIRFVGGVGLEHAVWEPVDCMEVDDIHLCYQCVDGARSLRSKPPEQGELGDAK